MSKRYGRNQKRAHRERIAELERRLSDLEAQVAQQTSRARAAEFRAANATEQAFKRLSEQQGYLEHVVKEIGVQLGRALGPELRPIAERILSSRREPSPMCDLSAHASWDKLETTVIRGEIPAFRYNIAIM